MSTRNNRSGRIPLCDEPAPDSTRSPPGAGPERKGRPHLGRREFLRTTIGVAGGLVVIGVGIGDRRAAARPAGATKRLADGVSYDWTKHHWAYAVDTTKCIGCGSCMRACRAENRVPEGYHRTWVERYEIDASGEAHIDVALDESASFDRDALTSGSGRTKGFFVPKLCNHCERSVCSQVCPVGASYQTEDGVVLVDEDWCIGCAYCVQACPYATRFINPVTHVADKCTFCYHRITKGQKPACVLACPVGARMFGNLKDPDSPLHRILQQRRYTLLRPELGTHPKCYYVGLDIEVK